VRYAAGFLVGEPPSGGQVLRESVSDRLGVRVMPLDEVEVSADHAVVPSTWFMQSLKDLGEGFQQRPASESYAGLCSFPHC
jgi:hypothetical protein